ncbi:ATP-binding protein [Streptomyces naphthomycinicus]|uniref:ATP-binding protein n=1 Tax=Streptomyces naphthomycinicus TaxID=2872625 RepID=UPI001CEDFFB6|nr:ATP-binding protein [Streptomyces sp. TML10]
MHPAQTRFTLEATPAAVPAVRQWISAEVRGWGVSLDEDLCWRLELVVSELVTNAVLHAGGWLTVSIALEHDLLLVEVHDGSTTTPRPRATGPCDETGRGLVLVAALCLIHGSELAASGKRCWAVLPLRSHAENTDATPDSDALCDSARWTVTPVGAQLLARLLAPEEATASPRCAQQGESDLVG